MQRSSDDPISNRATLWRAKPRFTWKSFLITTTISKATSESAASSPSSRL